MSHHDVSQHFLKAKIFTRQTSVKDKVESILQRSALLFNIYSRKEIQKAGGDQS